MLYRSLRGAMESLSKIDSANAESFCPADKEKVSKVIYESVGFEKVNACVKRAMIKWIGDAVAQKMQEVVFEADEGSTSLCLRYYGERSRGTEENSNPAETLSCRTAI